MTTIRHMVPDDAEAVVGLLREAWRLAYGPLMGEQKALEASRAWHTPDKLAAQAANEDIISFVAEEPDGRISGHAMAMMDENRQAKLARLYIAADKYGSGLADDLLRAILAAHAGLPSISLEVMEGNDRAIAFYKKNGFVETGRKDACGGIENVPTLVMTRVLPRA